MSFLEQRASLFLGFSAGRTFFQQSVLEGHHLIQRTIQHDEGGSANHIVSRDQSVAKKWIGDAKNGSATHLLFDA